MAEDVLHDVVSLLARLELERARLEERCGGKDVAALVALGAITNEMVAFVTARCHDRRVLPSRVLAELADTQPWTQLIGEEQERITVTTATELLENWTGDRADRQRMLQDLCRALIDVLLAYCRTVNSLLQSPRDRDEWMSAVDLFVADLQGAVLQTAA